MTGKRKPLPPLSIRFGSDNMPTSMVEVESLRLEEMVRLLTSDDPHLREMGRQRLNRVAEIVARAKWTLTQNEAADKARKVTPELEREIGRRYAERVRSGRKHGAVKALAAFLNLDEKTIREVLKKRNRE